MTNSIKIEVGAIYRYKHSSGMIDVKVLRIYAVTNRNRVMSRYLLLNLATYREIVAKSKTHFMFQIEPPKGQ